MLHLLIHFVAPNTVYEFRVQPETSVGAGNFSPSRMFNTAEDGEFSSI